jgi:hypothetical protein
VTLLRPSTGARLERAGKRIISAVIGLGLAIAGFAWLYRDVAPDGHVEMGTAIGVSIIILAGGFLVDRELVTAFVAWLVEQAKAIGGALRDWLSNPPPPAGGVSG